MEDFQVFRRIDEEPGGPWAHILIVQIGPKRVGLQNQWHLVFDFDGEGFCANPDSKDLWDLWKRYPKVLSWVADLLS